jgi:tetratricopeptide (TPR) repeat protein
MEVDELSVLEAEATQAKQEQRYQTAMELWEQAAQEAIRTDRLRHAAVYYARAGDVGRWLTDKQHSIRLLTLSAQLLEQLQIYTSLSKVQVAMAELLEQEAKFDEAHAAWEQRALSIRKQNGSSAMAEQALTKAADAAALAHKYDKAISIYEQIAFPNLDHSYHKYTANELLFRALLCSLAKVSESISSGEAKYDLEDAFSETHSQLERYKDESIDLVTFKDYMFFVKVLDVLRQGCIEDFTCWMNGEPRKTLFFRDDFPAGFEHSKRVSASLKNQNDIAPLVQKWRISAFFFRISQTEDFLDHFLTQFRKFL